MEQQAQNEDQVRRERIALLHEQERQKLLERIEREEEERLLQSQAIKEQKRQKPTLFSKLQSAFHTLQQTYVDSLENIEVPSDFSECKEELKETFTEPPFDEEEKKEEVTASIETDVLSDFPSITQTMEQETYALLFLRLVNLDYLKATFGIPSVQEVKQWIEVLGMRQWGKQFCSYEEPDTYVVVLRNCRWNQNAIRKQWDSFYDVCCKERTNPAFDVVSSIVLSDKHTSLEHTAHMGVYLCKKEQKKYEDNHPEFLLPKHAVNLQELTETITKAVESNAIVQARRQLEKQLLETGELDDDEPIQIRTADDMTEEEYDSFLSQDQQEIKEVARKKYLDDDILVEQVLHNIRKHNTIDDPLYVIAIASPDMNTLLLLEDMMDFESLCAEQDISMIQCSYIYAISRSGGHWYGNNHATIEIEELFSQLSTVIVQNGGRFEKELLYRVPNICIFKDIYFQ